MNYVHLISGKQEASNPTGQLRSMEGSDTARSGQFTFLVSVMVFASVPTLVYITTRFSCYSINESSNAKVCQQ